jgi:hypothetical protein
VSLGTLETEVFSFAYPYGFFNDQVKTLVKKSGYKYGITMDTGGMTIEDDYFAIFV